MSYCECDYDDYDAPKFYSETIRKARRPHKCCECSGPIHPGETYTAKSGKWDGQVETYHECLPCMEVRQWAKISLDCFCSTRFGDLHDDCTEMMRDVGATIPGWRMEYGRRVVRIVRRGGTRLETWLMRDRRKRRNPTELGTPNWVT